MIQYVQPITYMGMGKYTPNFIHMPVTKTFTDGEEMARIILAQVSVKFGLSSDVLCRKIRKRDIVAPRQIAAYFILKYAGLSMSRTGEILGGKHHSSMVYYRDTVKDLMDTDRIYKSRVELIEASILRAIERLDNLALTA